MTDQYTQVRCDHEFRVAQVYYNGWGGGTQPYSEPDAALVVCRKCGAARTSQVVRP